MAGLWGVRTQEHPFTSVATPANHHEGAGGRTELASPGTHTTTAPPLEGPLSPGLFQLMGWEERSCSERGTSPQIQLASAPRDSAGRLSLLCAEARGLAYSRSLTLGPSPFTYRFPLASWAIWDRNHRSESAG